MSIMQETNEVMQSNIGADTVLAAMVFAAAVILFCVFIVKPIALWVNGRSSKAVVPQTSEKLPIHGSNDRRTRSLFDENGRV